MIEAIRLYDRQAFNSDRRYYERVQETGTYLDTVAASNDQAEPKTVQDFLDHIEKSGIVSCTDHCGQAYPADRSDEDPGV